MKLIRIALLVCLYSISSISYSQIEPQDFESWNSIVLNYKLNKKWSFELDNQLRLDKDASEVKSFFTDLSVDYRWFKGFKTALGFRYVFKNDNKGKRQGIDDFARVYTDVKYKHKINDFTLKYRLRYQYTEEVSPDTELNVQYLRFKFATGYNIHNWKLDPVIFGEIFNHLNHIKGQEFDGFRVGFGTEYNMKKYGSISADYRVERTLNELVQSTTYILKLSYKYSF